jgi:hypothetical protein
VHAGASSSLQVWKRPTEKERWNLRRKRMAVDRLCGVAAMRLLTTSCCECWEKIARIDATNFRSEQACSARRSSSAGESHKVPPWHNLINR